MAIEAEYVSNILATNQSAQDTMTGNYVFQSGQGGFENHQCLQTPLFNNGVQGCLNPRKRSRDLLSSGGLSSFQPQPPQLTKMVELSKLQLHNVNHLPQQQQHQFNNATVSTGLHSSLDNNHQQNHQRPPSFVSSSFLYEQMSNEFQKESNSINHLITSQREELLRELSAKRTEYHHSLIVAAENAYRHQLQQKEAELQKTARRNLELEHRAVQLSMSADLWRTKAMAQRAAAASLHSQLKNAMMMKKNEKMRVSINGQAAEPEDAESAYIDPDRVEPGKARVEGVVCRECGTRAASGVVMPCRHLCFCRESGAAVRPCRDMLSDDEQFEGDMNYPLF